MKRLLLTLALLVGSVASASAACVSPAVMHDFGGTAFNMSLATNAGDGNCASNTTVVGTVPLPTGAGTSANQTAIQAPVAAGAATATKSVLLGGQFDTTQKTLTNGQQSTLSVSPRGAMFVAVGVEGFGITAASGGFASGSIASGAMVDLGAQADAAAAADNSTASLIALVKRTNQNITTLNTTAGAAVAAGSNTIGNVNAYQGSAALSVTNGLYTNVLQGNVVLGATNGLYSNLLFANVAASTGSGVMGTGTQRMALATDSPGIITLGAAAVGSSVPVTLSTTPTVANGSGTVNAPSSESLAAITPVVSAALESNHVIKAGAGNFYSGYVTTGATAGWLLLANSTTAPTAGGAAIAPIACVVAPANATTAIGGQIPIRASTGITLVFSSSGCLTNTASATAYFSGLAN